MVVEAVEHLLFGAHLVHLESKEHNASVHATWHWLPCGQCWRTNVLVVMNCLVFCYSGGCPGRPFPGGAAPLVVPARALHHCLAGRHKAMCYTTPTI